MLMGGGVKMLLLQMALGPIVHTSVSLSAQRGGLRKYVGVLLDVMTIFSNHSST